MARIAEKPALLSWLLRREFGAPFQMRSALSIGAQEVLGKSAEEAAAYAEVNSAPFWRYLLSRQEEHSRRGLRAAFQVIDSFAMTLSWCGTGIHNSAPRKQLRSTLRARQRPALLRMIDALSDREYEALGCVVAQLGGASKVFLTPPGNEGGVDFFALIPTPTRNHLFGGGTHPLRIVGQCKKYNRAIDEAKVKEFVETIQTVKYRGDKRIEQLVPSWFHATGGPIVGLMISHAGFQSGADTKARNHGFLLADSLDLAEIAAHSRLLPDAAEASNRASEIDERVKSTLNAPGAPAPPASPHPPNDNSSSTPE